MLEITIQRFDPNNDAKPYDKTYEVPLETGVSVLGVLDYIRKNIDETLAYKIFCTNQHCGECGVMLNNKPVLACRDLVTTEKAVLKPLKGFTVIKDLVVDIDSVLSKQWEVLPELEGKMVYSEFLSDAMHEDFFMVGGCIGCAICQSRCPLHQPDEDELCGPAYYMAIAQYLLRAKTEEDLNAALEKAVGHDLLLCTACKLCSKNCPKDIDPFKTIADMVVLADKNLDYDINEDLLQAALSEI